MSGRTAKAARRPGAPTPQFVYVIAEAERGPVKIGIGASPQKRLRELQIGNPRRLHLFWRQRRTDAPAIECGAHRLLRDLRLSGEWYDAEVPHAIGTLLRVIAAAELGTLADYTRATSLREVDGKLERRRSRCREWLPVSEFHRSTVNGTGYQARCKPCGLAANRERLQDPEARRRHNHSQMLRNRAARSGLPRTGPLTGERNPRAKIRDADRRAIVERALAGEPAARLAPEFGISVSYVGQLRRRARTDGSSPAKVTDGRLGADVR